MTNEIKEMTEADKGLAEQAFKEALSKCEGEFSYDKGSVYFKGKDSRGHKFLASFQRYGDFVSVGCEYKEESDGYYGQACPCHSVKETKKETEEIIKKFKMVVQEWEQMKLW